MVSPSSAWCSVPSSPRSARATATTKPTTTPAASPARASSPLVRITFAVYAALTAYATLYPFAGWQVHGLSPLAFLDSGWPRYVTAFDVAANVAGYVPLGFLSVLALHPRPRGPAAFLLATAGAALFSLGLEAAQTYLPARIASPLDLACNAAGGALGAAAGLLAAGWAMEHGPLSGLRRSMFLPGTATDLGLVLLGLWLFVQLNPATLLFGAGNLRDLLVPADGRGHPAEFFVSVEAFVAGANLLAVALFASALVSPGRPARLVVLGLVAAALVVRAGATVVLMRAESLLNWLTPGAQLGLAAGLALALLSVGLPRLARLAAAAVLVMAATVVVNLAPPNPYFAATLKVWQQGHFLNFNGLTRLVSAAWPFLALGALVLLAARRPRDPVR